MLHQNILMKVYSDIFNQVHSLLIKKIGERFRVQNQLQDEKNNEEKILRTKANELISTLSGSSCVCISFTIYAECLCCYFEK